jgi:hypothetical protein
MLSECRLLLGVEIATQPATLEWRVLRRERAMTIPKTLKTKKELEALVWERIGLLSISHLEIIADPLAGWKIKVFGDSRFVMEYQEQVDAIVKDLRQRFDLAAA